MDINSQKVIMITARGQLPFLISRLHGIFCKALERKDFLVPAALLRILKQ